MVKWSAKVSLSIAAAVGACTAPGPYQPPPVAPSGEPAPPRAPGLPPRVTPPPRAPLTTPGPPRLIDVVSATYGGVCGAPAGNATEEVAGECNGRQQCRYLVNNRYGDPARHCFKDFLVQFRCGDESRIRQVRHGPRAGEGYSVQIACPRHVSDDPAALVVPPEPPAERGTPYQRPPAAPNVAGAGDQRSGCVPPPSSVVSWWTGDDTFADQEGNNPGAAVGPVTFEAGKVGAAFAFNGIDAVRASTNGFPFGSADRTIELWAYLGSTYGAFPSETEMFAQYGTFGRTGAAFAIFTFGTSAIYWSQWGSSFTGGSMRIGAWTHIAATSSAGTITLYQDGTPVGSRSLSPYDTPAGTTIYLGGQGSDPQGKTDHLTGMVDEVTVYDRALSATEIESIYLAGSAGKCH
jgi:hypothetical protein